MICVDKVAKGFKAKTGTVQAVQSVSFSAEDGQITGLLGPNGAGKTTTLRLLYGLLRADSGSIWVDGCEVGSDPVNARRRLGVLPDTRGLYTRLTARENIEYFARLNGVSVRDAKGELDRLIENLEMSDFVDRRCEGFSQGQRTKTAIARSVIHKPQNIVLDEPTNGLDVMTTRGLRRFLESCRAEGRCVVLSTHIMQEVAALCDQVVVIAHGSVVAKGSPKELKALSGQANLEDAFVQLIGSEEGLML